MTAARELPIVVIGAGPVRLFSPGRYCVDEASRRLLDKSGWTSPDLESGPTGSELAEKDFLPLAETSELEASVRTGSKVVAVARYGLDKMKNEGRDLAPFVLTVEHEDGSEETVLARAVIDASGTYSKPDPLGTGGIYAPGEKWAATRVPDAHGSDRSRYAGKRIAVVGSGHSAFNALIELSDLASETSGTQIFWAVRKTLTAKRLLQTLQPVAANSSGCDSDSGGCS